MTSDALGTTQVQGAELRSWLQQHCFLPGRPEELELACLVPQAVDVPIPCAQRLNGRHAFSF